MQDRLMGYQPTTRPELLSPPGNPNVYCGECSTRIEDGLRPCPKCGTSYPLFPSVLPIPSYTGESSAPSWSTTIQKGGGRELLHEDDPFALDKRLLGEPTYSHLIEDFMLALSRWLLSSWCRFVAFMASSSEQKPKLHFDDKVWVTEGMYQGMYGNIRSQVGKEYLVGFPKQDDKPYTSAWFLPSQLTMLDPQLAQDHQGRYLRAYPPQSVPVVGVEGTQPEPLLRLPVQRGGSISPPPDAHVAIHQIGTPEPIGWFDSAGNWLEALPHADHDEMQFAPADWRSE